MDLFTTIGPTAPPIPILISVPHCGTLIPPTIAARLDAEARTKLPDTDWFVDQLYEFAPGIGATLIAARYSRFVIDLNRAPGSARLYNDGRTETELVPTRTFRGTALYATGDQPTAAEVHERQRLYYDAYHAEVRTTLARWRRLHRHVLLWDAHSIARQVPTIRQEPFADMILGDNLGNSAAPTLIETVLAALKKTATWNVAHNEPFRGGWLTRANGNPSHGIHALQLEMSQDIYMDDMNVREDPTKKVTVQALLETVLGAAFKTLELLP